MKKYRLQLAACCLGAIFCIACNKKSAEKTPEQPAIVPFRISISTGGGFTGLYQGFTLHSDGKIEQWQKDRAGEVKILKSRQVDVKEFVKFRKELERDDIFKIKLTQTGNMTTKIVYQKWDSTFVWTWQAGGEIPPQMQKWYDSIRIFCKQQIQ